MLLTVNDLTVKLTHASQRTLVQGVSFELAEDQCLGILGESGSGKSVTCSAINGLLNDGFDIQGSAKLQGQELLTMDLAQRRHLRGQQISMIMQSPMTAFNPLFTIGNQAVETIRAHKAVDKKQALAMILEAMAKVNLQEPQRIAKSYPHELSGGMLQRVMIAFALVLEPKIIIADEPTTAIDYISQREVVKQLQAVREQFGTSFIFISHDLSLVSRLADNVLVMDQGRMVDYGPTKRVFTEPQSAHTKYLIDTRMQLINRFKAAMQPKNTEVEG